MVTRKEMIKFMLEMEREFYNDNKSVVLKDFGYRTEKSYMNYMDDVFSKMSDEELNSNYSTMKTY